MAIQANRAVSVPSYDDARLRFCVKPQTSFLEIGKNWKTQTQNKLFLNEKCPHFTGKVSLPAVLFFVDPKHSLPEQPAGCCSLWELPCLVPFPSLVDTETVFRHSGRACVPWSLETRTSLTPKTSFFSIPGQNTHHKTNFPQNFFLFLAQYLHARLVWATLNHFSILGLLPPNRSTFRNQPSTQDASLVM